MLLGGCRIIINSQAVEDSRGALDLKSLLIVQNLVVIF